MISELLNGKIAKTDGVVSQFNDFVYTRFLAKKSHKQRIRAAQKVHSTIVNSPGLSKNPAKLFSYLRKIDPFVFEELLLLSFKKRGIRVIRNKRYTGDGGIDGKIVLANNKILAIQAKRYSGHIVSSHVDDFVKAIDKQRCNGGLFIHTGKTGQKSYSKLSSKIHLISGNNLYQLIANKH